jgi:hypothetical protein
MVDMSWGLRSDFLPADVFDHADTAVDAERCAQQTLVLSVAMRNARVGCASS